MKKKYIEDESLNMDTPNALIDLFDEHSIDSFGTREIEKSKLIGVLSLMNERQIGQLNKEIIELLELYTRLKDLLHNEIGTVEDSKTIHEAFIIQEINKLV